MPDLDMNKVKQNKYNINCNNLFNNKSENYQKMRKKYIQRLSSFLLKNRNYLIIFKKRLISYF